MVKLLFAEAPKCHRRQGDLLRKAIDPVRKILALIYLDVADCDEGLVRMDKLLGHSRQVGTRVPPRKVVEIES